MYRRIVVAYNAGNEGRDALALAAGLARPDRARVVVVQAMPARGGRDVAREAATRMAAARASIAEVVGHDLEAEYHPLVAPFAPSVHAAAAREGADLVVAGQSRLGAIARAHLGGGAELLVAGARCPIAIAAPEQAQRAPFAPRVVAAGYDGSPRAALALCAAADLSRDLGARLRIVTVGGSTRAARAAAARLAGDVRPDVVGPVGDPARALLRQVSDGVDALVVGHRDHRPHRRAGVSDRVMANAGCPVWVVPSGAASFVLARRASAAAA